MKKKKYKYIVVCKTCKVIEISPKWQKIKVGE